MLSNDYLWNVWCFGAFALYLFYCKFSYEVHVYCWKKPPWSLKLTRGNSILIWCISSIPLVNIGLTTILLLTEVLPEELNLTEWLNKEV